MKAGRRDARADPWLSFALRFPRCNVQLPALGALC